MAGVMSQKVVPTDFGRMEVVKYSRLYWTALILPNGPMASGETEAEAVSKVKRLAAQALTEQRAEEQKATA